MEGVELAPLARAERIGVAPAPRIGFRDRLAAFFGALRWAAAAALVAGGVLVWSVQQGVGPHPSAGTALLARLPGGRIMPLAGTGAPGAGAQLYVLPNGRQAELVITGLPPLPADRTYQLWFARPGQPTITGGAFRVDSLGQAAAPVIVPAPLGQVSQIAVTEEPSPGSTAPTGQHLLDWLP